MSAGRSVGRRRSAWQAGRARSDGGSWLASGSSAPVHQHRDDGHALAGAQRLVELSMHVVLVAVLQVRGEQLRPLLPDQGDDHAAGGQLGLDLVKPSHSRSQRAVVEEHVGLAKVLLELHVNRPRGALSLTFRTSRLSYLRDCVAAGRGSAALL
jgi:hypothetical protein